MLSNIHGLADKLITDIQHRGLAVGDRYLTTAEVSRMLGVRKAAASRAVRQLAERDILIPRRRTGTFIGPGFGKHHRSIVRTVYVLLPAGDPSANQWAFQPFIQGIRNALVDVNVQFAFLPKSEPLDYIRALIDAAQVSGQFAGVVSVSCPPEVYRFLAELRIPAVVHGSLFASDLSIASVDMDNRESGRLLAGYLAGRGHRRMALLITGAGRPGNNHFLDGVSDSLGAAELPHNAMIQRLVGNDITTLQSVACELLEMTERPTAVITRGRVQADTVATVVANAGLRVPNDIEIVFDDEDSTTFPIGAASGYPQVRPKLSFAEIAAQIGDVLKEQAEGTPPQLQRVIVPVEFFECERGGKHVVDA